VDAAPPRWEFRYVIRFTRPWNAGRIVGAKPPLKPKHIWGIRTRLQLAGRIRDLAMFNWL
jgi:hypothetical protein